MDSRPGSVLLAVCLEIRDMEGERGDLRTSIDTYTGAATIGEGGLPELDPRALHAWSCLWLFHDE